MKIAGFIPNPESAKIVVHWTLSFAEEEDEVEFLCYESWFGDRTQNAAKEVLGENTVNITLLAINDQLAIKAVESHLRKENTELLITSQFKFSEVDGIKQDAFALINDAPCRTFSVMHGEKIPEQIKKVLFFTTGYVHDRSTLRLISALGLKYDWEIRIASVEEETGAKAGQSSEQNIRAMIHDVGLDPEDYEIKVVVDRMILSGIRECYDNHEMVVAGMDAENYFRHMEKALPDVNAAIVKRIPPLRLKSFVEWLPRINPADHADLLHELRQGSFWGPDFIVMLGLAAAVSSLGLILDSPAVVIGSMLLAPLMTPMMGLGLALAQANTTLMRMSLKSIFFGFLLTVGISFAIGYITPSGDTLSQEVINRGSPNVLDLMIALFAAAAAAFAMARPNIVGAIAGVAIATALVPPACSIGISLSQGAYLNGFGAALLFFTNLIAIIAASSFMFQFLGISSSQSPKKQRRVAILGRVGLVVILLSLFAPMSYNLVDRINEGKNVPMTYPVTRAVANAVNERINQDEGVELMLMARKRSDPGVLIHLASNRNLPKSYADELTVIVRREMNDPDIPVKVTAVKSIWETESDKD